MKEDITISFVVLCYNQESMILETLESIRYQIEQYALETDSIQLIVMDDGSTDNTVKLVELWTKKNAIWFSKINIDSFEKNRGTCKCYCEGCRKIEGEHFFVVAGDDLIANTNVLDTIKKCKPNQIIASAPYRFMNNEVIVKKSEYINSVSSYFFSSKRLTRRALYCCPIVNGAVYGKDFINESILNFIETYDLLEDRTRWVKSFELYSKILFDWSPIPILLYRISEKQVSNETSPAYIRIKKDKEKLIDYSLKKHPDFVTRIALRVSQYQMKPATVYTKIIRYFNIEGYIDQIIIWKNRKKINSVIDQIFDQVDKNQVNQYLTTISNNAKTYI